MHKCHCQMLQHCDGPTLIIVDETASRCWFCYSWALFGEGGLGSNRPHHDHIRVTQEQLATLFGHTLPWCHSCELLNRNHQLFVWIWRLVTCIPHAYQSHYFRRVWSFVGGLETVCLQSLWFWTILADSTLQVLHSLFFLLSRVYIHC